jgi:hypothetical protein
VSRKRTATSRQPSASATTVIFFFIGRPPSDRAGGVDAFEGGRRDRDADHDSLKFCLTPRRCLRDELDRRPETYPNSLKALARPTGIEPVFPP